MKEIVGVVVYRDTIESHNEVNNLSAVYVTKDFMEKYFEEVIKPDYKDDEYKDLTADKWFYEVYTADDTEDFYWYAKEHNAVLSVKHDV